MAKASRTWTSEREHIAAHEAAHAACAAVLDLPITFLTIEPSWHFDGMTWVVYNDTPRDSRKRMQVVLAPLLLEGHTPPWPLDPGASTTDERRLHTLASNLGLDRRDYEQVVADTVEITERPAFKRLHIGLSHAALTLGPTLDERCLDRLIGELMGADLNDEIDAVLAHERSRKRSTPERTRSDRPGAAMGVVASLDHVYSKTLNQIEERQRLLADFERRLSRLEAEARYDIKDPRAPGYAGWDSVDPRDVEGHGAPLTAAQLAEEADVFVDQDERAEQIEREFTDQDGG